MAVIYELELIHCIPIPVDFSRHRVMIDFKDYYVEDGLDGALTHILKVLSDARSN